MPAMPPAEIEIDADLVRRLVRAQFPDLAARAIVLAAHGWDNEMYRLGDDLVVRLPRRSLAVELARTEHRWLPVLSERLSVPIPTPLHLGSPSDDFPWPWSICRWIEGMPIDEIPLADRLDLIDDLARALGELHVPAPADAPRNRFRGIDLIQDGAGFDHYASRLPDGAATAAQLTAGAAIWQRAIAAPTWGRAPLWLHGDLHPRNIIVTPRASATPARLAAIIDFGDMCSGDPAGDLAIAWTGFDAPGRAAFQRELAGRYDDSIWTRAHGWAALFAVMLLAENDDHPALQEIGRRALRQVSLR